MMWGPYGDGSGGWWGMSLAMGGIGLVLVVLLVVLVVMLSRRYPAGDQGGGRRALDVLDERFARGEIDAAEYEQRRRTLTGR